MTRLSSRDSRAGRSHQRAFFCPIRRLIWRFMASFLSQGTKPRTLAFPAVGCNRPESIFRVVVFPAPFGPKKPDEIAFCDLKGDVIDRARLHVFAVKKALQRPANSPFLPVGTKRLGEPLKFDGDHSGLPELEVGVELLIENPPRIESQSPDILPRSALRAGSRPKARALSPRRGVQQRDRKELVHFWGSFMLQNSGFIRSPTAR